MAVRIENRGKETPSFAERAIQVSGEIKTRQSLEANFLDAVTVALDSVEYVRVKRRFLRQRPQPATHQNLFANLPCALLPFCLRANIWKRTRRIQGFYAGRLRSFRLGASNGWKRPDGREAGNQNECVAEFGLAVHKRLWLIK